MCTPVDSEHVWVDTNDEGSAYYRNLLCRLDHAAPLPEFMYNVPYGQGTSLFALGRPTAFLEAMQSDTTMVQVVAEQLAAALPADCPKECRIQLCLHQDDNVPAIVQDASQSHLTLVVCGHDPVCARDTRLMMALAKTTHEEEDTVYQAKDLLESSALMSCDEESRSYRKSIAKNALDLLQCSYDFSVPEDIMSHDNETVYDTMNFNNVHLSYESADHFLFGMDFNIGTDACIFHSPQTGCSVFMGESNDTKAWRMPASNGRNLNIATADGLKMITTNCMNLDLVADFDRLQDSVISYTTKDTTQCNNVAVQNAPDGNKYTNIDVDERTYNSLAAITLAPNAPGCNKLLTLHALTTSVPVACRPNGMISSVLECRTLSELLAFTTDFSDSIRVPNTPHWQQQLTKADVHNRPFHFMNENTAILDENEHVSAYEINRTMFS